jgi:ubiquinone/menaquinone biosynthesis C-methylase UbiE
MSGCGTSRLSEEMYDDGFSSIVNIDFVAPAIDIMATRNKGKSGLTWQVMDATALTFPDAYFDAVIDKGTLDSLLCGENSTANASKMCAEMARVLKPGGNYMVISYGNPESRLAYLEKEEYKWRVTAHTLRKCHFLLYRPTGSHIHSFLVIPACSQTHDCGCTIAGRGRSIHSALHLYLPQDVTLNQCRLKSWLVLSGEPNPFERHITSRRHHTLLYS